MEYVLPLSCSNIIFSFPCNLALFSSRAVTRLFNEISIASLILPDFILSSS